MLVHVTNMADEVPQNNDPKKSSKQSSFHKIDCKTRTGPEGITEIAVKLTPL